MDHQLELGVQILNGGAFFCFHPYLSIGKYRDIKSEQKVKELWNQHKEKCVAPIHCRKALNFIFKTFFLGISAGKDRTQTQISYKLGSRVSINQKQRFTVLLEQDRQKTFT